MSLILISEIPGLFVNTLIADHKYTFLVSGSLQQQIQMQISKKEKVFSEFFNPFLKSTSIFEHYETK